MRIGYLYGFQAYPPRGGNHLHVYQLVRRFIDRGHEVRTLGDPGMPGVDNHAPDEEGVTQFLSTIDVLYVRIDGWYLFKSPLKRQCMAAAEVPIVWEINAPANEALAFSWLGDVRRPNGVISKQLDVMRRGLHAGRKLPEIYFDERLRCRYARRVSAAICVSDALKRYAVESLKINNSITLPNGGDLETSCSEQRPLDIPERYRDYYKVLYAGSPIYPWQGLDVVREVIEKVQAREDKILFLLLVNQGSPHVPKGRNVKIFNGVPYQSVGNYIRIADVCLALHPEYFWSRWGFHGSSMKMFDYMACAKPVVASRVGQMARVLRDGYDGILANHNADAVLEKILYLRAHPQEASAIGQQARQKIIDRHNWDFVAEKTLDVLAGVLR